MAQVNVFENKGTFRGRLGQCTFILSYSGSHDISSYCGSILDAFIEKAKELLPGQRFCLDDLAFNESIPEDVERVLHVSGVCMVYAK